MKVTMIKCDNPECDNLSRPESDGSSKRLYTPYGWIFLKGHRQGVGPRLEVTVCSAECVTPAIERKIHDSEEKYR